MSVLRRVVGLGVTGEARVGTPWRRHRSVLVFACVFAISLLRMLPARLVSEEPSQFWATVPTTDPMSYLLMTWAGYVGVWARAVFLVGYQLGDAGPLFTRICSAAVIGAVAAFFASHRLDAAIPFRGRPRIAFALSLAVLPITNPYVGPLNSQWWVALAVLGIALSAPRRGDTLFLFGAGFVGIAPLFMLPAFRDRRAIGLLIPAAVQVPLELLSRHPVPPVMRPEFASVAILLLVALSVARLPRRTRGVFLYAGLATLAAGWIAVVPTDGGERYLTLAWVGISLGLFSWLGAIYAALTEHSPKSRRKAIDKRKEPADYGDPSDSN
jgi:hypothetical protein